MTTELKPAYLANECSRDSLAVATDLRHLATTCHSPVKEHLLVLAAAAEMTAAKAEIIRENAA